jgi:serine/threonine protein kinase
VGLTGPGFFVGTPFYAAPEQIQGRAVDGRADQYALACVAFQLLAGALPFRPDQDLPVLLAHVSAPPPSLTAQRPDLPRAVDRVMARAMAKNPEERYASCLNFADALREALGLPSFDPEGPVTAAMPHPAAPARDTVRVTPAVEHPRRGAAFPRPVTARSRRYRLRTLGLAGATLAAAGAIAFVVASPAKSPGPVKPPGPVKSQRPTASGSPASIPSYPSVPIKLPSPYAGRSITSLAFSPAGTTLAIANGRSVCLWDIAASTGCRTSFVVPTVDAVAFSPDGKTVAVGGIAGRVALLNAGWLSVI